MRYMMMVKAGADYEAGRPPNPELMLRMGAMAMELQAAGIMLMSEGLLPSSHGARIDCRAGRSQVTDGPFSEAKEVVGGFAIMKVNSKAEAIALAQRAVDAHIECGMTDFAIEVRELSELGPCRDASGAA